MAEIQVNITRTHGLSRLAASFANPQSQFIRDATTQMAKRYEVFALRRYDLYSRGGGDWAPLSINTIEGIPGFYKGRRKGGRSRGGVNFGGGRDGRGARSSLARDTSKTGKGKLVRAGGTFTILKDRGLLRNAIQIGNVGNALTPITNGVRFGFSQATHPAKPKSVVEASGSTTGRGDSRGGVNVPRGTKGTGGASRAISYAELAAIHHHGNEKKHLPARRILVLPDQATKRLMAQDVTRGVRKLIASSFQGGKR